MLNRLMLLVVAFIMNACLLDSNGTEIEEERMSARVGTNNLQQRSRDGTITPHPNHNSKFSFQLPLLLNPDGKPDPGAHTVQFTVEDANNNLALGNQIRIRAEILWKTSGGIVRRVVDVGNGVSVSGVCEGVDVTVYDDSVMPAAIGSIVPVAVTVNVAKGTRPSISQPPTYSVDGDNLVAGGDSGVFVVPDNIGAVSVSVSVMPDVIGTALGAYDIQVTQAAKVGGTNVLKEYDPRQDQWVPLVPGTRAIKVETSAAAPAVNVYPVFGIDG